ncbi:MAG: hypothetical protein ACFFF9_12535 [Candidatus Thorarchaeota archaeon]
MLFGKGLIKIIGLIITGAIALAGGAELLASVVSVVLSFRSGNPLPLVTVVIIAVVLLRLVKRQSENTPVKLILNIASYAASGYVAVVTFVIGLPYGLVAAVATSVIAVVLCSFMGDPSSVFEQLQLGLPGLFLGVRIDGLTKRVIPVGNGMSFALNKIHNLILIDNSEREKIVQLMRDRPRLPVSLTHFEDSDVLFITTEDQVLVESVRSLLVSARIDTNGPPSPLLGEVIQMIPIIDERNGLFTRNYRLARDEKSVSDLLLTSPIRMIVFPSDSGPMIIVPDSESTGLNVETLPTGHEHDILLNRDFKSLMEESKPVESST